MERRKFLKWATNGLGALFGIVLGAPAILYLIDSRNRPARQSKFKPAAKLNDLQVDVPKQVVLADVRRDAWTLHPNDVIGRVWLIRRDKDKVDAYTTICPHLGCSINFHDAPEMSEKRFICPCHNGTWDFSCKRVETAGRENPAPRDMDLLKSRFVDDPATKERVVEVQYENFEQGKEVPILKK